MSLPSSSYARRPSLPPLVSAGVFFFLGSAAATMAADVPAPPATRPQPRTVITIDGDRPAEVVDAAPPLWQARKPATRPVAEATLGAWFAELAASDAAAREAALGNLLDLSRDDLAALRRVVERARPVAPSQAHALRDVVTHVYLSGETYPAEPRIGFLGLGMPTLDSVEVPRPAGERPAPEPPNVFGLVRPNTGVPVEHRIPGFCAFRALRDGDVVLSILEPAPRRLRDWSELTYTIRTFPAGQKLVLEVLRRGAVLNVPVTLDAKLVLPHEDVWHNDILPRREAAAAAYWSQHFAPLVEESVSQRRDAHGQPPHARAE